MFQHLMSGSEDAAFSHFGLVYSQARPVFLKAMDLRTPGGEPSPGNALRLIEVFSADADEALQLDAQDLKSQEETTAVMETEVLPEPVPAVPLPSEIAAKPTPKTSVTGAIKLPKRSSKDVKEPGS